MITGVDEKHCFTLGETFETARIGCANDVVVTDHGINIRVSKKRGRRNDRQVYVVGNHIGDATVIEHVRNEVTKRFGALCNSTLAP